MEKTTGGGMNSRIQELALECGAWHQVYGNRTFMIDEHFDIKKFAQLIVKECAQDFDNTYMRGGKTMGAYIREKFGVET
jgi:hypothetical protein